LQWPCHDDTAAAVAGTTSCTVTAAPPLFYAVIY